MIIFVRVGSSFSCPVSLFFRNSEESFIVLYGSLEISNIVIGVSKIVVRSSFSCPVSHFFRNFEEAFIVLYGYLFFLLALVFQLLWKNV